MLEIRIFLHYLQVIMDVQAFNCSKLSYNSYSCHFLLCCVLHLDEKKR